MTEQETIRWLSRAYWLRIRITKMQEQRRQMQALAEGVRGMDYSRSITQGGEPQTLLDAVARLVDLDAKRWRIPGCRGCCICGMSAGSGGNVWRAICRTAGRRCTGCITGRLPRFVRR